MNGKQFSEAACYQEALKLDPENADIEEERDDAARKLKAQQLRAQGEKEMAAGQYPQAMQTLLSALHADPKNREIAIEEAEAAKKNAEIEELRQQRAEAWRSRAANGGEGRGRRTGGGS